MAARTKPPRQEHYCLFETSIGPCGVAWSSRDLTRLQLPEANRPATEERIKSTSASASREHPPAAIAQVIVEIQRYLAGRRTDFSSVPLDLTDVSAFHRRVYEATRGVGWGRRPAMVSWRAVPVAPRRREPSARRCRATPSPSSFRVTGSWRAVIEWAGSRRMAAQPLKSVCWRWRVCALAVTRLSCLVRHQGSAHGSESDLGRQDSGPTEPGRP
jgi:hypothetical protein